MIRILPLIFIITSVVIIFTGCSKDPTGPDDPLSNGGFKEYTYIKLNAFPHDSNAFTQGLVFHEGYFYEGTGLYGSSSLRKIEVESGTILQQVDLSTNYFGEGITIYENHIYQLTWLEKKGFIYHLEDFDSLGHFSYNHEGWGLTHNGSELIISDGTATIRFVDPKTLKLVRSIEVISGEKPLRNLNELEYIDGRIYANIWLTDWIVIIDPENGRVTGRIDLTGLLDEVDRTFNTDVLNGIAYDMEQNRLFVTGKRWPKVFEIEVVRK